MDEEATTALGRDGRFTPSTVSVRQLQEQMAEYRAENRLLGNIIQDLQAELHNKQTQRSFSPPQHPATAKNTKAPATRRGPGHQAAKSLGSKVESLHEDLRLRDEQLKAREAQYKRRIKELGDMVLDITDEAAGLRKQLELREQESRSLRDQLTKSRRATTAGRGGADRAKAAAEDALRGCLEQLDSLEQQLHSFMAGQGDLAVQYVKRLEGLEAVLQKSQDMQRIEEGCQKAQKAEWSYIKRDLGLQVEALRRRNQQLQAALADAKGEVRKANKGKAEARAEARGAAASLATIAQAESAARAHGSEALQKVERLRGELVEAAEHAEAACIRAAALSTEGAELLSQNACTEKALQAARQEVHQLREALLEAKATTIGQVLAIARSAAQDCIPGNGQVDGVVEAYIRVLEHSVREAEEVSTALRAAAREASREEAASRDQLLRSRESQARAASSLQTELKRVHRLEVLRLSDVRELHDMETRLGLLAEEAHYLRDSLAAERYKAEVEREASWRGGARDEGDAQNENLPDAMPPHKEYRSEMQPHVALSQYREAGEDATTATNKSDVLRSELDCLPAQNSPGGEDAIHGADTPAAALQRARQMAERWAGQAQPNLW